MDAQKAANLESTLINSTFGPYQVIRLINHGKSAAVFEARDSAGQPCALKVFDNELIQKFGKEIQLARIEKEIGLKDHSIPNLVQILDGGQLDVGGITYHYIVMEYIDGLNLKEYYEHNAYGADFIRKVLKVLTAVTDTLLNQHHIVHRDIKPENIMVRVNGEIVLMDLGVIRIIDSDSYTDHEKKEFIGTLLCASPEFLLREEEDSADGWRAVNLYQIGVVLHDLIMRKGLFSDLSPYGRQVKAVLFTRPTIAHPDYPYALIQLTSDLLGKDWKIRLQVCTLQKIAAVYDPPTQNRSLQESFDQVFKQAEGIKRLSEEIEALRRTEAQKREIRNEFNTQLRALTNQALRFIKDRGVFTSFTFDQVSIPVYKTLIPQIGGQSPYFGYKDALQNGQTESSYLCRLNGPIELGYVRQILLLLRIRNDDLQNCTIAAAAILPGAAVRIENNIELFINIAADLNPRGSRTAQSATYLIDMAELFDGTPALDQAFTDHIIQQLVAIITPSLQQMLPEATEQLEFQHQIAGQSRPGVHMCTSIAARTIIVNRMPT
jgi:serine/threonine protein kinase